MASENKIITVSLVAVFINKGLLCLCILVFFSLTPLFLNVGKWFRVPRHSGSNCGRSWRECSSSSVQWRPGYETSRQGWPGRPCLTNYSKVSFLYNVLYNFCCHYHGNPEFHLFSQLSFLFNFHFFLVFSKYHQIWVVKNVHTAILIFC